MSALNQGVVLVCGGRSFSNRVVVFAALDGLHASRPFSGCKKQVPPAMWGCKAHWFLLPKYLRDCIWAAYRPGQEEDLDVSREYRDVADEVPRWIAENEEDRTA
jgi:hypothetical protein